MENVVLYTWDCLLVKFYNIRKVIFRNILASIKELLRKHIARLINIWPLVACRLSIAVFCLRFFKKTANKMYCSMCVFAEVEYRAATEGV